MVVHSLGRRSATTREIDRSDLLKANVHGGLVDIDEAFLQGYK